MADQGRQSALPEASGGALMDRIYRHQRHVYDLTRKYYLLGRDGLIRDLQPPAGGTVLEIECGTGRNLIGAATRYPNACFYGFDISAEMLRTARANAKRVGLAARVQFAEADASCFDAAALFGERAFDRIFISYALSMIPPWQDALARAIDHLAPGGRLHVVDFGQLERLPPMARRLLFAWLKRFHVAPRADLPESLRGIAERRGAEMEFRSLFRGYAWSGTLARPRADQAV